MFINCLSLSRVISRGPIDKVKSCAILKKKGNTINFRKVSLLKVYVHILQLLRKPLSSVLGLWCL